MADKKKPPVWGPAPYTEADAASLQALQLGKADEAQQKRALNWIIRNACLTYEEPFVAGQPDVSQNMAGRRSAGLQIVKLCNLNLSIFRKGKP